MEHYIKVNGRKTCNMALAMKSGSMGPRILDSIFMDKKMELGYISGMMDLTTRENGKKTRFMEL
jgi:hypothetical protein